MMVGVFLNFTKLHIFSVENYISLTLACAVFSIVIWAMVHLSRKIKLFSNGEKSDEMKYAVISASIDLNKRIGKYFYTLTMLA
jgi:hypothetical protein